MAKASPPFGRNQKQLGDVFIFVFVSAFASARCLSASASLAIAGFAFREERDPLAVGRPLRRAVVAGLRQLRQAAGGGPIEPEFLAEDLLLPVGLLGCDDDGVAVRRNFHRVEAHRVEEFIEREFGLGGLGLGKD